MEIKDICPCVNLACPNHGKCENCTSRHARQGYLNYCGFYTVLPTLQDAIKLSPDSPTAKALTEMFEKRLATYRKLTDKHGLDDQKQEQLFKKVADFSDY